ncbi:isocitrate/isopropylmalate dehydrogenase family protein [Vogesella sp. XCS3]|uniref:isocitrate/isopropylmalate dehydrogenase family protein n=1 Tax=Vogesella sp. XCS3 TaxID=2877939 RepID=UPI001D0B86BC|nr:isocitrate/isopropylmalate family dehydrogenase [Vogesella sp. XCS3]UDM16615.1 3-isopropylmalate dehydrogenase [Vogesella sp. XCS3]
MKLCVIAGDGIGQEVVPQAVRVLQSLLPALQTVTADAGWATFQQQGTALPDATLAAARDCGAVLFGAVSSPARAVAGYRSPIVQLRRQLGCYANLRPTLSLPGCGLPGLDVLIVRENTEDLYVGEEHSDGDTATAIKRITRTASLRVAESAFALAAAGGCHRVTIVHKANILPLTDGLFRDCAREVATRYPQLQVDEMLVDTAALKLAQAPQAFDVLLAPNLYGDILSDLAAAFGGGLGVAASLNLGQGVAIAEPVHGSAPDIAGQGVANPVASLLSLAMLLRHHWHLPAPAMQLEQAVQRVLASGTSTPDLGGSASTAAFCDAVMAAL